METAIIKIKKEAQKLLDGIGIKAEIDAITTPPDPKLGDFHSRFSQRQKKQRKIRLSLRQKPLKAWAQDSNIFQKLKLPALILIFLLIRTNLPNWLWRK